MLLCNDQPWQRNFQGTFPMTRSDQKYLNPLSSLNNLETNRRYVPHKVSQWEAHTSAYEAFLPERSRSNLIKPLDIPASLWEMSGTEKQRTPQGRNQPNPDWWILLGKWACFDKWQEKKKGGGGTYTLRDLRDISIKCKVWTLYENWLEQVNCKKTFMR